MLRLCRQQRNAAAHHIRHVVVHVARVRDLVFTNTTWDTFQMPQLAIGGCLLRHLLVRTFRVARPRRGRRSARPAPRPGTPTACDAEYDYASRPQAVHDAVGSVSLTGRIGKPMITLHGDLDALLPIRTDSDVYNQMIDEGGPGQPAPLLHDPGRQPRRRARRPLSGPAPADPALLPRGVPAADRVGDHRQAAAGDPDRGPAGHRRRGQHLPAAGRDLVRRRGGGGGQGSGHGHGR